MVRPVTATRSTSPLQQGDDTLQVEAQADGVMDRKIPLEVSPWSPATSSEPDRLPDLPLRSWLQRHDDWLGCCAHGAERQLARGCPVMDTTPGVEPDKEDGSVFLAAHAPIAGTSALLRADNRGVCERCHDK